MFEVTVTIQTVDVEGAPGIYGAALELKTSLQLDRGSPLEVEGGIALAMRHFLYSIFSRAEPVSMVGRDNSLHAVYLQSLESLQDAAALYVAEVYGKEPESNIPDTDWNTAFRTLIERMAQDSGENPEGGA